MSLADTFRKMMAAHPLPHKAPAIDPASGTWQGAFGGPGVPMVPLYGDHPARRQDYQFSVNVNVTPRSEYNGWIPSFDQLRLFYSMSSILKVAVTFRKQQILSNSWNVTTREGAGLRAGGAERAKKLLTKPDPTMGYNFEAWLGMALEAAWVHDALTIVPIRSGLGKVVALQVVDGTTLKPLIDYSGGFPAPPEPAFLQIIKGSSYTAYTTDDMLYKPFGPRDWCIYGQSRIERVLEAMTIYQLYESWVGDFFTQGNLPEVAYLTDKDQAELTNPKKFRKWQRILDIMHGKNVGRRRVHLVPPFVKAVQALKAFTFEKTLPDWFVRPLCIEFGIPAFMFVSETNRATASEINESLYEPSIRMDLMSTKRLLDDVLSACGMPEQEFNWEKTPDYSEARVRGVVALSMPATLAEGLQPVMTRAEARDYLNLDDDTGADEAGEDQGNVQEQASEGQAQLPAATPAPAEAEKVVALKSSAVARIGGRRFAGPKGKERARLAAGFAPVIAKRLRQRQAEVVRQGVDMAHSRQLQVRGAENVSGAAAP